MFDHPEYDGHESVTYVSERASGLHAIIAIHSTVLGPAGGGVRMFDYERTDLALTDALRLSKGMTYKAAMSDLPFGGGKAVVIGDPARKTDRQFEALGDAIEALGGRYFCGEDVGTTPDDMAVIHRRTSYVVGLPGKTGDPSPATAEGVYVSILAAVAHVFGSSDLRNRHVAVQGLGNVGARLVELLAGAGARLTVADLDTSKVDRARARFGAAAAAPEAIHKVAAAVFSPCALGAVVNDSTVDEIGARIICGSANNQLATPQHGRLLHERGVVYVPDYVASVGGAISAMRERIDYVEGEYKRRIAGVGERVRQLLERSVTAGEPPAQAADAIARSIVEAAHG